MDILQAILNFVVYVMAALSLLIWIQKLINQVTIWYLKRRNAQLRRRNEKLRKDIEHLKQKMLNCPSDEQIEQYCDEILEDLKKVDQSPSTSDHH